MQQRSPWLTLILIAGLTLQSSGDGGFRLPDQPPKEERNDERNEGSVSFGDNNQGAPQQVYT